MMDRLVYTNGQPIELGDRVRIKRRFRRDLVGCVNYVYDHTRPAEREVNDYGFSVKLAGRVTRWYGCQPGDSIVLEQRGTGVTE